MSTPIRLVLLLLFASTSAQASTLVVDAGGGGDFTTISGAITAAVSGDVVQVEPGTCVEDLDFGGKSIELIGLGGSTNTSLVGTGGSEPVVRLTSGEGPTTLLQGFDISGTSTRTPRS